MQSAVVYLYFAAYKAWRMIRLEAARKGFSSRASHDASTPSDIRFTLGNELLPFLGTRFTSLA
jgi:hypothetical protein